MKILYDIKLLSYLIYNNKQFSITGNDTVQYKTIFLSYTLIFSFILLIFSFLVLIIFSFLVLIIASKILLLTLGQTTMRTITLYILFIIFYLVLTCFFFKTLTCRIICQRNGQWGYSQNSSIAGQTLATLQPGLYRVTGGQVNVGFLPKGSVIKIIGVMVDQYPTTLAG